ncbi:MAG: efflux RND transporter permease subunit [Bacteroidota bacterium]|nr:efflux RND transporter permease subunit [Bacteroidota bacterium]
MLNRIILFSLQNRTLVLAAAALILVYGAYTLLQLPVDVLPDLNRPRVTIFLEAPGMAPEEIETQISLPVEQALNGAPGVEVVRSSSSIGLGLVFVEFGWDTEIYRARQLVSEKLQTVSLPDGITPVMGPISSVMGQIMLVGISADSTSPANLRTLADFVIRPRLKSIKGVAEVIPIGGERLQYQVLISSTLLKQFNLTVDDVDEALSRTNLNTTGGFFDRYGEEVLIRNIGRAQSIGDLENTVVRNNEGQPVFLKQIAEVKFGAAQKRGDGSLNGKPAVILTIEKQPGVSTISLTDQVEVALNELQKSLPPDVKLNPKIFQQKNFITHSLTNVMHALRDGGILVVLVLFLFLLNFRTTAITLTAIPLSLVITALVFKLFGITINTLTLGGLAIAIGELVDDAVVDVENVFRRLKENRLAENPRPILRVIYEASSEVRNSIVFATIIVVLVFIPLFYLQGIEGKLFAPLGIAYVVSIVASLLVSLTVTPVLCSFLLARLDKTKAERESGLVRWLKKQDLKLLNFSLDRPKWIMGMGIVLIAIAGMIIPFFGSEFLPPFNEGSFTINLSAPPGTSLEESNKIGSLAEYQILKVDEVLYTARRTGRAELDEHVEPVSNSEIEVELKEDTKRKREEILSDIRANLSVLQGVSVNVGQPISHRIDHLLSGVRAQVAIKLYGQDLTELRTLATQIKNTIESVEGVVDANTERQTLVPQLRITVDRMAIARYGMQVGEITEDLEIMLNGKVTGTILDGQKSFDILLRANEEDRANLENIRNAFVHTPEGNLIPLEQIANVEYEKGVNAVSHENTQRIITISANVEGRDLGATVQELKSVVTDKVVLPEGYFIQYGGQYEAQQSGSRIIGLLSLFSVMGIFIVLFLHFRSWRIVLQIMLNIPLALVGSVIAVWLTGGVFSLATMVGFITLTGIASRNGIMMISHYIHLVEHEGEIFDRKMIVRGSLERLVPVLMTALVAALALIPLTLNASAPGKEILYPVATVILGGLISSTLLDMAVTPAVFSIFGRKAIEEYMTAKKHSRTGIDQ